MMDWMTPSAVVDTKTKEFGKTDGSAVYIVAQENFITMTSTNKITISNADAQSNTRSK